MMPTPTVCQWNERTGIIGPRNGLETLLMNFGHARDEGPGVRVVGVDEVVDVLSELFDRGEGLVALGLFLQDREPD
jgi:hypothetical protein